jgi:transposase
MRSKGIAAEWEVRRRLAAKLFEMEATIGEVMEALDASESSVKRWKKAWKTGGVDALRTKPHPGPKPRLDRRQKDQLVRLLLKGARAAGFDNDLWTCPRVARMIEERFGVRYHVDHVWHVLRGLGWTCQKPELRPRERDDEQIRRWRERDWPRIKKELATQS